MTYPRLPDWAIYGAATLAFLFAAIGRRERADSPPPPPPPLIAPTEPDAVGPASAFDPQVVVEVADKTRPGMGTAFSVADDGVWLTARHVVDGCAQAAIVVAPGQAAAAKISLDPTADAAVLTTEGGAPAMPVAPVTLKRGERAFHPGYPQGGPGEATSRLLGRETMVVRGRGARTEPTLAWAEVGRTDTLHGTLAGLSGAPALDETGRVIGITIAESPRRGRIYTTAPETVGAALKLSRHQAAAYAQGQEITLDNYGRVADDLRRDLRVAQVVCLAPS